MIQSTFVDDFCWNPPFRSISDMTYPLQLAVPEQAPGDKASENL